MSEALTAALTAAVAGTTESLISSAQSDSAQDKKKELATINQTKPGFTAFGDILANQNKLEQSSPGLVLDPLILRKKQSMTQNY